MDDLATDRGSEPKVNVLLVDDRLENLLALESVLNALGQNIVTARSGREALRKVLEYDFACILLDVQMPEMNGFECATLIRSREKSQHTPILFLTAINKSDRHVTTGYSVGAVDYVFKPIEPDILKAKVSAFVDLSLKTKALEMEIERRRQAEAEAAAAPPTWSGRTGSSSGRFWSGSAPKRRSARAARTSRRSTSGCSAP
jgi:PleD family two-component response regulator